MPGFRQNRLIITPFLKFKDDIIKSMGKGKVTFAGMQEHSEGTSSVAFEVLILNCKIYFINLFIFNSLMPNINLFNLTV